MDGCGLAVCQTLLKGIKEFSLLEGFCANPVCVCFRAWHGNFSKGKAVRCFSFRTKFPIVLAAQFSIRYLFSLSREVSANECEGIQ